MNHSYILIQFCSNLNHITPVTFLAPPPSPFFLCHGKQRGRREYQ